jgi:cytochrome d ubiquinol oxidase subunit I
MKRSTSLTRDARVDRKIGHEMAHFWTKIFALTFAIGVATGIVMEFEFGTNWATYSRYVGDIFGSALAAEGIYAFFLESGFLAVLLFGWNKVGPKAFSLLMRRDGRTDGFIWRRDVPPPGFLSYQSRQQPRHL